MSKANVKGDNRGWKRLRGDRSSLWSQPAPLETVGESLYQLPKLRNILYGLIWVLVTTHVPLLFIFIFQCDPVRKAFDKQVDVFSFLTDFICAAFPAFLLWNVRIKTKTKVGVCLLMGLGIVFEVNIGIIAACAPVFRPFVRYVRARITGQDPHRILRPFQTSQTWHSSWYSRFWRSKSNAKEGTQHAQGTEFRSPTEEKPPKATKGGDASNETDVTISLPIQGVQERQDSMTMMPPARALEMYDSGSTLGSQVGADKIEKDIV
ncbi:MAG: hypothetical protein Q9176_005046 [Flavoplaca citrina]